MGHGGTCYIKQDARSRMQGERRRENRKGDGQYTMTSGQLPILQSFPSFKKGGL
jgi:hypothetical protein